MKTFAKWVVDCRVLILLVSLLLLIPSLIGYAKTKVNYDILYYLPDHIETMQGQDILVDEFGTGAYSMVICEGMESKEVARLKQKLEKVEHVSKVLWYDSILDLSVPMDMIPKKVYESFNADNSTMMFITFDTTSSADETMAAIEKIREIGGRQCFLSGMSAVVTDTKNLAEKEVAVYVLIAVLLSTIVLSLSMESWMIPFLFLSSIGMAIVYNMGSNYFLGEISYITKALSAVLQLGVTMDYSIFLWHSYQEEAEKNPEDRKNSMRRAIEATLKSVVGSSITTIAGFIALCFMSFALGMDLGICMTKGVVFGVITCVTVLPSMILVFDKGLEKTKHRQLIPDFPKVSDFVVRHHIAFAVLFMAFFIPFAYFQSHTNVYYNLDSSLPASLPSIQANKKLSSEYKIGAEHMLLLDKTISDKDKYEMIHKMEKVDGVKKVLGLEAMVGPSFPKDFIPDAYKEALESQHYELMLIMNSYPVASTEVNRQIDHLSKIVKSYDPKGMVVGEAPCTKDLIEITDHDFKVVSAVSILAVFIIILFVFRSISLPVILVAVIEGAIFVNMGIPFLTGTKLPFIASIVIGTIQLGATVDYAILMTSRYEKERGSGKSKREAIQIAHQTSMRPVIVSAASFCGATLGVGLYSNIDMISALCLLMARGAIISMAAVLLFLPAMYWLFDGLIIRTSKGFQSNRKEI